MGILPHVLTQALDHAAPQMVCKRCRTPKSARRSSCATCKTSRRGWIAAGTPHVRHGRSRHSYRPRTETPGGYAELTRDEMQVVLKAKGLTQRGTREECVRRLIQASKAGEVSEAEPTLHSDHVDDIDSDGRISSFKWAMNQAIDLEKKFATMAEDARKKLDELEGHEFDVQANAEGGNEGIHHADHVGAALAHAHTLGKSRVRTLPHVLAQAHDHAAPEMVCKKCRTPKSVQRSSCSKCRTSRHGWIAAGTPPLTHGRSRHPYSHRTAPSGAHTELIRDETQVVLTAKGLTQRGTREKCVQRLNEASEVAEVSEAELTRHSDLGTGNLHTKEFLPFIKALLYARSLKLKSKDQWMAWCKSGLREPNVSTNPQRTYKHEGWQGYGHWLGTGTVASKDQQFLPFKKALLYARCLKLGSQKQWNAWSKSGARPANMPSTPQNIYQHDGWQGYGHWLGTGNVRGGTGQQFLPFKKALVYARSLKLKGYKEWEAWRKTGVRHYSIPSHPDETYKHDGWQGYGHWLGTGTVASKDQQFLPFKKALLYARCLKLGSQKQWSAWSKSGARPANMPSAPQNTYKHDGWQGYGHWLGTGNVRGGTGQQFLPFKKALLHARSLTLKNRREWKAWNKSGARPGNVPSHPETVYTHDGWQGYGHWLGSGNREECVQRLIQASEVAEVSKAEPTLHSDHVDDIDSDGRISSFKWAMNQAIDLKKTFAMMAEDARKQLDELGRHKDDMLANEEGGNEGTHHADHVGAALAHTHTLGDSRVRILPHVLAQAHDHAAPEMVCKKCQTPKSGYRSSCAKCKSSRHGWVAAGTPPLQHDRSHHSYRPRTETPGACTELTRDEMQVVLKAKGITRDPHQKHRSGQQFLLFEEALVFTRALKLKTQQEWHAWCKSGARPATLPAHPETFYNREGWQGYIHWLGSGPVALFNQQYPYQQRSHCPGEHYLPYPQQGGDPSYATPSSNPGNRTMFQPAPANDAHALEPVHLPSEISSSAIIVPLASGWKPWVYTLSAKQRNVLVHKTNLSREKANSLKAECRRRKQKKAQSKYVYECCLFVCWQPPPVS